MESYGRKENYHIFIDTMEETASSEKLVVVTKLAPSGKLPTPTSHRPLATT